MAASLLKVGRLGSLKVLQADSLGVLQKVRAVALSSKSGEGKKSRKSHTGKSTSKTYFDIEKLIQHKTYPGNTKDAVTPAAAAAATSTAAGIVSATAAAIPKQTAETITLHSPNETVAEVCPAVVESTSVSEVAAVQPAKEAGASVEEATAKVEFKTSPSSEVAVAFTEAVPLVAATPAEALEEGLAQAAPPEVVKDVSAEVTAACTGVVAGVSAEPGTAVEAAPIGVAPVFIPEVIPAAVALDATPEVKDETTNNAVALESEFEAAHTNLVPLDMAEMSLTKVMPDVIEAIPTDVAPEVVAKAGSTGVAPEVTAEVINTKIAPESAPSVESEASSVTESVIETVMEAAAEAISEVIAEQVPLGAVAEVVEAIAETVAEVVAEAASLEDVSGEKLADIANVITDPAKAPVAMDTPEADLDPIQKLFLDSIRRYSSMSTGTSGPVDAGPEYHKVLAEEISKLQRLYGSGDLDSFPEFNFPEPKLDDLSSK